MSLHTAVRVPRSQAAPPPLRSTLTGAELPQAKISLASTHAGSLRSCPTLCDPVVCGLPGFSVREGDLQPRILVAIPFWSTIFPAALASNSPEDLELPEPLQPNQLHHLHTWPSQGQTQVLQGSLRSKPQWMTQCRDRNKTTIETQRQYG